MTDKKKKDCGCGSKNSPPKPEVTHNSHYYEQGRNGWTPETTNSTIPGDPVLDVSHAIEANIASHGRQGGKEGVKINPKMLLSKEELKEADQRNNFGKKLLTVTREVTELLMEKNKAYGDTALNPPRIFSKLSSSEAICARLDDKISRIQNKGINDDTEDTVNDLIGYLLLLKMAINEEK